MAKGQARPLLSPSVELNLPVILGTVREGRKSEHVARYIHARLSSRPGVTSPFVDPRDHDFGNLKGRVIDLPDFDPKVTPGPCSADLREFIVKMHAADGFVIVTPEYNYSYPGALKNLLDVTFKPWNRKPFALVGCGGESGGLRAIDMLRQTVAGLGAITVPSHLPVFRVEKSFTAEGPVGIPEKETFDKRLDSLCGQLEWYAKALKDPRQALAKP